MDMVDMVDMEDIDKVDRDVDKVDPDMGGSSDHHMVNFSFTYIKGERKILGLILLLLIFSCPSSSSSSLVEVFSARVDG